MDQPAQSPRPFKIFVIILLFAALVAGAFIFFLKKGDLTDTSSKAQQLNQQDAQYGIFSSCDEGASAPKLVLTRHEGVSLDVVFQYDDNPNFATPFRQTVKKDETKVNFDIPEAKEHSVRIYTRVTNEAENSFSDVQELRVDPC